jgi:hypothetical protein
MRSLCPRKVGALLLLSALYCESLAATEPVKDERSMIELEFWAAIGAHGPAYQQFRDRLVARGTSVVEFAQLKETKGDTWQEGTMAAILLERVRHPSEVEALLRAEPTVPYHRWVAIRFGRYAEELVSKARKTPMVLVESIWKGNALIWENEQNTASYAASALGTLREKRAIGVLIDAIGRSPTQSRHPPSFLNYGCHALGAIGDAQAVPVLLTALLGCTDWRVRETCSEAIGECLDKRMLRAVREAAHFTSDTWARTELEKLIKEWKPPAP